MTIHEQVALQPGQRIAGYEIVRVIGGGGFGIIYEGYNKGLDHRAAIKEFFPHGMVSRSGATVVITNEKNKELYERVLRRFEESTRALRKLDHPSIIKVHGYESTGQTAYMIMDFVEGETLRDWVAGNQAAVSETALRQLLEPVCDALAYCHERGVLHRDISPDNVMLEKRTGRPILIDFGALKQDLRSGKEGVSSVIVAREEYAPLEQLGKVKAAQGPYTDIFALAASMYELISGEAPVPSSNRAAELIGGADPYVPLARVAKVRLSPRFFETIDRALRLPVHERPQTMAEFTAGLGWTNANRPAPRTPQRPQSGVPEAATRAIPGRADPRAGGQGQTPSRRPPPSTPGARPGGAAQKAPPERRSSSVLAIIATVLPIAAVGGGLSYWALTKSPARIEVARTCDTEAQMSAAVAEGETGLLRFVEECRRIKGRMLQQAEQRLASVQQLRIAQQKQQEDRARAEAEQRRADEQRRAAEEARLKAVEEEARRTRDEETRRKAEEDLRRLQEENRRLQAEAERRRLADAQAEEERRRRSQTEEQERQRLARLEDERRAAEEAKRKAAEEEARRRTNETDKRRDDDAQRRAAAERREESVFQSAVQCFNTANPCRPESIQGCTARYRQDRATGDRESEVARLADQARASCAVPNGTYAGTRGYNTANPPNCLAEYRMTGIRIADGRIDFESDGRNWSGTINQRTGDVNIPFSGITAGTQPKPRHETHVRGHFRNAVLFNGLCGNGYFRMTVQ